MIKQRLMVSLIFIALIAAVIGTGCKKKSDDNNPTSPTTTTNSIVGTWALSKITVQGQNNHNTVLTPQQAGVLIVWVFNNDNTGTVTVTDSSGTTTNGGNYTFKNNVLTIVDSNGGTQTFQITFTSANVFTMPAQLYIEGTTVNTIMEFTRTKGIRWE
ncbi:MAG: lipocalin family protein [Bacillota bacterium]